MTNILLSALNDDVAYKNMYDDYLNMLMLILLK